MFNLKTINIKHYIYIALILLIPAFTHAAVITVTTGDRYTSTNGLCSINEAILNANDDAATYPDCEAGSGADTINLSVNVGLDRYFENDSTYGQTGTPAITSEIIVDGMSYTVERVGAPNCNVNGSQSHYEFRHFRVASGGFLTLQNMTIKNGCPDGSNNESKSGGAVFNEGTLEVYNSLFIENYAQFGGAISNNEGTINDIANNTFSHNVANTRGGAIYNLYFSTINSITNNTFVDNWSTYGGAIYNYDDINNLNNNLFSENVAVSSNSDCGNYTTGSTTGANNLSNQNSTNCNAAGIAVGLDPATIGSLDDYWCANPTADGDCVMTYALLPSNQAIDSGDGNSTDFDQRGFEISSIFDTRDIGAYEVFIPEVTSPPNLLRQATGPTTAVVLGSASVTDVDETTSLTATPDQTGPFAVGVTVVTWSATDSLGHIGTDPQTITIIDTKAPVITLNGENPMDIPLGANFVDPGATANDLVDGSVAVMVTGSVDTNTVGSYTLTYTATDSHDNTAMVERTVNVIDLIFKSGFE